MKGYLYKLKELLEDIKKMPMRQLEIIERFRQPNNVESKESIENELRKDNENLLERIADYEELITNIQNEKLFLQKDLLGEQERYELLKKSIIGMRNELLDLKGAIRVFCRIRPTKSAKSKISHTDSKLEIEGKEFTVDKIFSDVATQDDVFSESKMLIQNVFDGYNVCMYAYGQTGSGKTYTMEGNKDGLIYKSLTELGEIQEKIKSDDFSTTYTLKYIEIYNEAIVDLFTGEKLTLSHMGDNNIKIKGVKEIQTSEIEVIREHIQKASNQRRVGSTDCNNKSSRSHAIFILDVFIKSPKEERNGCLCLIDLAGSERLSESKAENERLKETQNINSSLSALGNVFNAIKRKEKHVPFRDSKLTHVMQKYLTGHSRVAMIVNLNLESPNECICTLRFASKVSECQLGKLERKTKRVFS